MIRKAILRLLLASVAIAVVVVTAIMVAGYLALQQPGYYAALRAVELQPADQAAAELYWRQTAADYERWMQNSIARQQAALKQTPDAPAEAAPLRMPYNPATDTHEVRFTQRQLNAQLAGSKATQSGDWRNPRVRIGHDCIDVAFEVTSDEVTCFPSIALRPAIDADGNLRLEIVSAQIGQLPLPMKTILRNLPEEIGRKASRDVQLDLTSPSPSVTVNLPSTGKDSPTVKSLTCQEGEMVVEFLPPVIGGESL
ncbi:YpmS family protein [Aeoliella sp. ICT_H6.2]|uniref:YpmS family protein n=1 Tax=Aeoliella straminimaris TaxID=2954799 RepID=A0A9X2FA03_9BACT|nr:YpmS family protein [Aeoliella straminimaris]MCO6045045.1 YpmS family protein [Aeoliella straminimaris]